MFLFAELVAVRVATNDYKNFNTLILPSKPRFKFYDRLLLTVLLLYPNRGKEIFSRLFGKVNPLKIFSFLEEKSSWRDEFNIFNSLPFRPFLQAFGVYLKSKTCLRLIFASLLVLTYQVLDIYSHLVATYFSYAALILGLLWLGIPHGALDHLLSKKKKIPIFIFVLQYLIIMSVYLLFWQIFPSLSLLFFVVYASFHLGESELIQDNQQVKSIRGYINSVLTGLSILLFIISTHWGESIQIISIIGDAEFITEQVAGSNAWILVFSCISSAFILGRRFLSKTQSNTSLIILLILGVFAPLILAFGLYFVLQHSHNAWNHLKSGLGMSSFDLYKKSSIFTLGAVFVFLFIALFVRSSPDFESLWASFFIFVACVSLPHFVLMHLFYASNKSFQAE